MLRPYVGNVFFYISYAHFAELIASEHCLIASLPDICQFGLPRLRSRRIHLQVVVVVVVGDSVAVDILQVTPGVGWKGGWL